MEYLEVNEDKIDFKYLDNSKFILDILLLDRTTNKNIIWATDQYSNLGNGFQFNDEINANNLNKEKFIIKPRILKEKHHKISRTKVRGEVFTPPWVCNHQNNLIDEKWFEIHGTFNIERENSWVVNQNKVLFKTGFSWKDYVLDLRLEITCGEAPYLVSRYDTVCGNYIEVKNRIGILDRKIRVVNENVDEEIKWLYWVENAFKSTYAYEWQGDNLIIARENLFKTFEENYFEKFNKNPSNNSKIIIAEIISWNIVQMDGIKGVIPNSCKNSNKQISLFGSDAEIKCPGCENSSLNGHIGIYTLIKDWGLTDKSRKVVKPFIEL